MRILLVEDDYLDAGAIRDLLAEHYRNVEMIEVANEADFVASLSDLEENPPDLVIMDIMIPWQRPSASLIAPSQGANPDPLRTGIRLLAKLQESSRLRNSPVILHSALEWHDVESDLKNSPDHILFVHKEAPPTRLMIVLRALLGALRRLPEERDKSLRGRIWDAFEANPSLGGFGVNLKRLVVPRQDRR